MAHRVGWPHRAPSDLEGVADSRAGDAPRYASNVVKKVPSQIRILAQFPRSGRKVPEFDNDNVREVIVYSYRVIDRIHKK